MGAEDDFKASIMKEELGELYYYTKELKELSNIKGIQARMPYDIKFN